MEVNEAYGKLTEKKDEGRMARSRSISDNLIDKSLF